MKCILAFVLAVLATVGPTSVVSLKAPFDEPNIWPNRSGIVHLLEWKWLDIAKECEEFLAPKGYAAVQISPPTENLIVKEEVANRPWYERYHPISYNLVTRSGNEQEFAEMTRRCNKVGVRIYADVVLNHMTQNFDDAVGTGGSKADANNMNYPAVPYETNHFHKPQCAVNDFNDPKNVRNCELNGLHDLDHSQPFVREKIINLLNHLIDLGVAGFRVDAAKHMWPEEVLTMLEGTKALNTEFGFAPDTKPFVYQEVFDLGGEAVSYKEYTNIGRVLDFRHSFAVSRLFMGFDQIKKLKNWGKAPDWENLVDGSKSVVFVDNHYNQRDSNGLSNTTVTYKRRRQYRMAVAFMLAHPHSLPRVMSSYKFDDPNHGPPMTPEGALISPTFNKEGQCDNGYVCEHRWRQIANMITFRNIASGTELENWFDEDTGNVISFSRGNKAFILINAEETKVVNVTVHTGLSPGTYCDIISGDLLPSGKCTGEKIKVDAAGNSTFEIHEFAPDGVYAIHINSKMGA